MQSYDQHTLIAACTAVTQLTLHESMPSALQAARMLILTPVLIVTLTRQSNLTVRVLLRCTDPANAAGLLQRPQPDGAGGHRPCRAQHHVQPVSSRRVPGIGPLVVAVVYYPSGATASPDLQPCCTTADTCCSV